MFQVIGSSLLILYDHSNHANIWLIDFAKTLLVEGLTMTHRAPWQVGNHEDGYLVGLDHLAEVSRGHHNVSVMTCYHGYK